MAGAEEAGRSGFASAPEFPAIAEIVSVLNEAPG
jgi:hypothetical protein